MKKISSEKAYEKVLADVYELMQKGEKNITNKETKTINDLADAIYEYEKIFHPFPISKPSLKLPDQIF